MAQPIQHLEPLIDAAVAALRTNLDAAIDQVNAAHTDFALDHIPASAIFLGGFSSAVYPMIEVAFPDWTMTGISLGQITGELNMSFVTTISCVDATPELLYRRLMRYVSAMLDVLMEPNTFGGGVYVDRDRGVRGAYRYNPETREKEEFQGTAALVLYLDSAEVTP